MRHTCYYYHHQYKLFMAIRLMKLRAVTAPASSSPHKRKSIKPFADIYSLGEKPFQTILFNFSSFYSECVYICLYNIRIYT